MTINSPPWKLSPSDFHFVFDKCKCCYYLKAKHKIDRPKDFPGIFSKFDSMHKNFSENMHTSEISPEIPPGVFENTLSGKTLISQTIDFGNDVTCYIYGKGDAFIRLDDGTHAVVDFKTTKISADKIDSYKTQLNAYSYALEHNTLGKPGLSPITKLGIICFEPENMTRNNNDERFAINHSVQFFEIEKNEEEFLNYIRQIAECLSGEMPDPNPNCKFCNYRKLQV